MSVVLILGAGSNIGQNVATVFAAHGWRIASASRSREDKIADDTHLDLHVDLSQPGSIPEVFRKVKSHWAAPSVVIYNGAKRTLVDARDPLTPITLKQHEEEMAINLTSAFIAAQQAVLNVMPSPAVLTFGLGKTAAAHMIWDASVAYKDDGFRFYFTDERFPDGSPIRDQMSGEARAAEYIKLAQLKEQGPWHYTFVKGMGYTNFYDEDRKAYFL
ncbi:NAD(P)-binding protein [Lindgomyces ingoldianus]|uniref:NAD(P)-binding protein n=1 Tax=Lindgomyces ingoldianus TaxID=673940 RepID=A0ACB6QCN9_9PLEO|nr:NAD(P)-binding protein [Lindgomyces ingoldianus]KAF2464260.1 NAD(P)-binding protein [Lindgomyces ingoldianus]